MRDYLPSMCVVLMIVALAGCATVDSGGGEAELPAQVVKVREVGQDGGSNSYVLMESVKRGEEMVIPAGSRMRATSGAIRTVQLPGGDWTPAVGSVWNGRAVFKSITLPR